MEFIMNNPLLDKLAAFGNWAWGIPMVVMLFSIGAYYSFAFKFRQITWFKFHIINTLGTMFKKDEMEGSKGTISGFAAACSQIASTIGVGNVAGVATAITMGGPGAMFWIWVTAWIGMATKTAEIIMGHRYRVYFRTIDEYVCGIPYCLKNGLNLGWLGKALTSTIIFAPVGLAVQNNAIATAMEQGTGMPAFYAGILSAAFMALAIIGGLRSIAKVADKVVPFMAVFYILGGYYMMLTRAGNIIPMFVNIYAHAFAPAAAVGGFAGATVAQAIRYGVARSVYSNEAGMGSGTGAHAAAIVDHPVRQASWGMTECLVDTIFVCSITGFAVLISDAHILNAGVTGAKLTTMAFQSILGPVGGWICAISTFLFGWTTIMAMYYSQEKRLNFFFGDTPLMKKIILVWKPLFIFFMIFGSRVDTGKIWAINDFTQIIGIVSNVFCLTMLRKEIVRLANDFYERYIPELDAGKKPAPVSFANEP